MIVLRMGNEQPVPADNPWEPDVVGYAPGLSEQECWQRTRGTYRFDVKRVAKEDVAVVITADRVVRAVADITGITPYGDKWALEGTVQLGHPLVGRPAPAWHGGQNGVGYFPTDLG